MDSSQYITSSYDEIIDKKPSVIKRIISNIQKDDILFLQMAYIYLARHKDQNNRQFRQSKILQGFTLFEDIVMVVNLYEHRKQCLQRPIWIKNIVEHCQQTLKPKRPSSSIRSRMSKLSQVSVEQFIAHMETNQKIYFFKKRAHKIDNRRLLRKPWLREEQDFLIEVVQNWDYMKKHIKTLLRHKTREEIIRKCEEMKLIIDQDCLNDLYEQYRKEKLQRIAQLAGIYNNVQ